VKWFYYLHVNGDLIGKNPLVADRDPTYFDSPFVRAHWLMDTDDRSTAWSLLIEALDLAAGVARVKDLAAQWGCNLEDLPHYLIRNPDPTAKQRRGLRRFIEQVLGLDVEKTFDNLLAKGPPK